MIPNKFVILWDDYPVAIEGSFPIEPYPKKTKNPKEIYWFDFKDQAQRFIDREPARNMRIVEIQFRIMDNG